MPGTNKNGPDAFSVTFGTLLMLGVGAILVLLILQMNRQSEAVTMAMPAAMPAALPTAIPAAPAPIILPAPVILPAPTPAPEPTVIYVTKRSDSEPWFPRPQPRPYNPWPTPDDNELLLLTIRWENKSSTPHRSDDSHDQEDKHADQTTKHFWFGPKPQSTRGMFSLRARSDETVQSLETRVASRLNTRQPIRLFFESRELTVNNRRLSAYGINDRDELRAVF